MSILPARLELEVILVVGMRLGCLNHALLTAEAIAARSLRLVGWVANTVDSNMSYFAENVTTLTALLPAPCLGIVPRLTPSEPTASAKLAATFLDIEPLLD
jgi:dethiobiotin synthetase